MRLMSKIALAGAAACTLVGTAYAADREFHRMNVALPDGSVAHLLYQGDVAPKLEIVPIERTIPVALIDSPFGGFDQMFAEMDRQAAVMMQQAAALQASAPAGASYSFTSYSASNGGCTQSYQMTAYGNAEPKVVSQSSGDCSKAGQLQAAPKPAKVVEAPKTIPHDAV